MSGCCAAPSLAAWPASGAATLDGISTVAPASTNWHSRRRWCRFPLSLMTFYSGMLEK